jgi:hypothetical protein
VNQRITIHDTPNFRWVYELRAGDTWTTHPAGGIVVCAPDRPPIWCREEDGKLVQEVLGPAPSVDASGFLLPVIPVFKAY